jgi:phosphohistidine phosphatase
MNLYIIRHGIATDLGTTGSYDDSQRVLTEAGRKKMLSIAMGLYNFEVKLDLILSSPYLRARETAEVLADMFKMRDRLVFSENLIPPGYIAQLIDEINEKYLVDSLAIVGHLNITMKKGGVCHLSTDKLHLEGGATLEWLLTPAQLVRLGE